MFAQGGGRDARKLDGCYSGEATAKGSNEDER